MTIYSKFNIVYHLQKWMDSVPGQTFLNYAYSWGASVVILGTLFKLTHLPGANIMLFAGMGTEVFVFFISAFDRPFDKTQEGRDLPTHIDEEEIDRAVAAGARIIGVNCRDLRTFKTDPSIVARLIGRIPSECVRIAESGIRTPEDVRALHDAGANGFLIGTTLMRAVHPGEKLRELKGEQ